MARIRADRTEDEWLECGDKLLASISTRCLLYKDMRKLLDTLEERVNSGSEQKADTLSALNSKKGEFDKPWGKWVSYINGKDRENKRETFRVSNDCYSKYKTLAKTSGYMKTQNGTEDVNLAKCVEGLPDLLAEAGIINTQNLGDLAALLKPFDGALQKKHKMTLDSNDSDAPFSVLTITESILAKLAELNIKRFSDFDTISRKIERPNELESTLSGLGDQQKKEIDELNHKIALLTKKLDDNERMKTTTNKVIKNLRSKLHMKT